MAKITLTSLNKMKKEGCKIACLTAYDASFARIIDEAEMDVTLVGDSLGMVIQGDESTLKVSMRDMIYHTRIVSGVSKHAFIISDMPFMSYATPAQALGNAARLVAEGGAEMVKLEGGAQFAETIKLLAEHGIPVCAHLGLTPQSINKLGGYKVQGKDKDTARQITRDALALEAAGADMLVLECVPADLAAEITARLKIPVIGIGAGVDCDGQVLVIYDLIGITPRQARFSKNFLETSASVQEAIKKYISEVRNSEFPGEDHRF